MSHFFQSVLNAISGLYYLRKSLQSTITQSLLLKKIIVFLWREEVGQV